jgi:hypothetical protein
MRSFQNARYPGVDTSKAEGGKIADASSSGYSRARARNRFLKLIRITGTRFREEKEAIIRQLFWSY